MKKLPIVASMVLVSLAAKTNVHAFDGWRNGAECQPATAADAADLVYTQFGVHNLSTTANRSVICPIPTVPAGNVSMGIRAYDRNALFVGGNTNNVSCNIFRLSIEGFITLSVNLATSGGGPNTPVQAADISIFGLESDWMWQFQCSIPRAQTGQFSHLTFYYLQPIY